MKRLRERMGERETLKMLAEPWVKAEVGEGA